MSTLAAAAGTSLGRYQILKHLASGGMAEIYLARATGIEGFERYVVVKRILGEHASDKRFVTMFIDEARLAAQLHHQNIAQVYDCGQDDGTYYFAMEYVHGENLRELLKKMAMARRQLALEHALTIIAGGCAGLHYAHDKKGADRQPLGIVHRDVSPSNLIVAYDGGIKVVDFGIAKAASRMSETRSGTLKGKIAYMSPEQCLGKALDRRSDIFALGIVMYELTTVSRLFKGENDYITMNRIVTGDIPSPTKKRPDYPPALEAIVMKALALDPADRYQTAGEMLEAIEQFATRERISLSTTALGRFIRELFGERPEPWQDLAASEPRDPSSDEVDIVEVTRSNVGGDTAITPAPVAGAAVSAVSNASSVSYVPPPRRNWGWLAVGLLAAAVAIGAVIMAVSSPRAPAADAVPGASGAAIGSGSDAPTKPGAGSADKAAVDTQAADKAAADKIAEDKVAADKAAADKAAADKVAADKVAADKAAAAKPTTDKVAADKPSGRPRVAGGKAKPSVGKVASSPGAGSNTAVVPDANPPVQTPPDPTGATPGSAAPAKPKRDPNDLRAPGSH